MTPDNEIRQVGKAVLRQVLSAMSNSILVHHKDVEPLLLVVVQSEEGHPVVRDVPMEAFLRQCADAVERDVHVVLAEQNRRDFDLVHVHLFAKIVDQAGCAQDVEHREGVLAVRIVVVTVNAEDRQPNVQVLVQVVQVLEALRVRNAIAGDDIEQNLTVAHDMLTQDLHASGQRLRARLVLVKQVAAQQNEICLLLQADLQDLFEGVERIFTCFGGEFGEME